MIRMESPCGDFELLPFPGLPPPLPFWVLYVTGRVSFPKMDCLEFLWCHITQSQGSEFLFIFSLILSHGEKGKGQFL